MMNLHKANFAEMLRKAALKTFVFRAVCMTDILASQAFSEQAVFIFPAILQARKNIPFAP